MRMKKWKSGLNVHNALGRYMKAVSYQTIHLNHKTMTSYVQIATGVCNLCMFMYMYFQHLYN